MELNQTKINEIPYAVLSPNEPHLAFVLLLDTSGSMNGDPISRLNRAIVELKEKLTNDEIALRRVDVAIIEFNDRARVVQDFTPLAEMQPVTLVAQGCTAMGEGINLAIDKVKERNRFYDSMGTPCYRPWILMITDGAPTDDINSARERINQEQNKGLYGKIKFFAVGVPGYKKEVLTSLSKRCIALDEAKFDNFFNWVSKSMVTISVSRVGDNPKLPNLPEDAHVIPSDW